MIKTIACISVLVSSVLAASIQVGGRIPIINRVEMIPLSGVDFRKGGKDVPIAVIRINNNLPDFEVAFEVGSISPYGAEPHESAFQELRLREVGGLRGRGLVDPTGTVLNRDEGTDTYVWRPGSQQSATLNYEVEVLATWEKTPPGKGRGRPQLLASMTTSGL